MNRRAPTAVLFVGIGLFVACSSGNSNGSANGAGSGGLGNGDAAAGNGGSATGGAGGTGAVSGTGGAAGVGGSAGDGGSKYSPSYGPGAFYYIDYASGSDTNAGTSKSRPWQHAPGMTGCASNCARASLQPGDNVVFKGGVRWPSSVLNWTISSSGKDGVPIYIGVDPSWYSGSSWTRPVLDATGWTPAGGMMTFWNSSSTASFVTVDNLEFTGLHWSGPTQYGQVVMISVGEATNITIENSYFHGWSHGSSSAGTTDSMVAILGYTAAPNTGSVVSHCLFDGAPNGTDSGMAIYGGIPRIEDSVARNMSNGFVYDGQDAVVDGNSVGPINGSFDSTQHENCIEPMAGGNNYIFNNVFHDCTAVNLLAPGIGTGTDYIFDNVFYSSSTSSPIPIQIDDYSPASEIKAYIYNNTVSAGSSGVCLRIVDRGNGPIGTFDARNNLCITDGGLLASGPGATNLTTTDNVVMTNSAAAAAGMSVSQRYAFKPQNSTCNGQVGCPVGAGANLSGLVSANPNLEQLIRTTAYGCTVAPGNIVNCPGLAPVSRPSAGVWNAGAY